MSSPIIQLPDGISAHLIELLISWHNLAYHNNCARDAFIQVFDLINPFNHLPIYLLIYLIIIDRK